MPKSKEQVLVSKHSTVCEYEIRMNRRGDLLCAADDGGGAEIEGDFDTVSITKEELQQVAKKAAAVDKAYKALDAAQKAVDDALAMKCCEYAGENHYIKFPDPDVNDIPQGSVEFGCQRVYVKDVIRIAALSAKMRGK